VILPDGRVLNHELVRAGLAWWYYKYSTDRYLGELEAEARAAKRGLWSDPHAVAPWDFRRRRRVPRASLRQSPEPENASRLLPSGQEGRRTHISARLDHRGAGNGRCNTCRCNLLKNVRA
jgi:hypothetical protein